MKTLIILALAGLIGTTQAQPFRDGGDRDVQRENLHKILNLDDATTKKIEQLREDHQKKQIALRAKLQTARLEMRTLMRADNLDRAALLAKQKEISGIREEMQTSKLSHRLDVYGLLTPEQQKIWKEHRGDRRGFRKDGVRKFLRRGMRELRRGFRNMMDHGSGKERF